MVSGPGRLLEADQLTTDPDTLSKDHKGAFWSVGGKFGSTKEYESVHTADFAPYKSKHNGGLRFKELRQWSTSISLPGPETTPEAPPSQDATG